MMRSSSRREIGSGRTWRLPRHGVSVAAVVALGVLSACSPEETKGAGDDAAIESASPATAEVESSTSAPSSSPDSTPTSTGAEPASSSTSDPAKGESRSEKGSDEPRRSSSTTSATADTKLYRVIRVVDGDTVKVDINGEESVRVIGIDTPETVHPDKPTECGGPEASAAARELLDGQSVAVVYDKTQDRRDRYGRLLAYLDIPGSGDFGEAMLRKGHAEEYTYAAPYQRRETYRAAEKEARSAGRGAWGSCTTAQKQDQTPTPTQAPSTAPSSSPTTKAPTAPQPPAPTKAPAPPAKTGAPGPGWTNDALTPGYTGCRQGYPGGKINGVYWWKPISC